MSLTDLDCTTCGACCLGAHDRYVALLSEDRGRAIPAEAVTEIDGRRYMRMTGSHCAQLVRTGDGRLACSIYEVRPEACRAFRAGSFECLKTRQHRGSEAERLRQTPTEPKGPAANMPPAHVVALAPRRWRPPA